MVHARVQDTLVLLEEATSNQASVTLKDRWDLKEPPAATWTCV